VSGWLLLLSVLVNERGSSSDECGGACLSLQWARVRVKGDDGGGWVGSERVQRDRQRLASTS
jgi:hypothetical protein